MGWESFEDGILLVNNDEKVAKLFVRKAIETYLSPDISEEISLETISDLSVFLREDFKALYKHYTKKEWGNLYLLELDLKGINREKIKDETLELKRNLEGYILELVEVLRQVGITAKFNVEDGKLERGLKRELSLLKTISAENIDELRDQISVLEEGSIFLEVHKESQSTYMLVCEFIDFTSDGRRIEYYTLGQYDVLPRVTGKIRTSANLHTLLYMNKNEGVLKVPSIDELQNILKYSEDDLSFPERVMDQLIELGE